MKICLVHHEYPEETSMGGIATYQRMLAQTLRKMGHQVIVIAASLDVDKEEDDNGVHVFRFSKCIQYDTVDYMTQYREKVADKLHELFLEGKIEIIESPEMGAECLRYIEKYHDVPVVCKLHTSFEIWAEFNETTLPLDVHNQLVSWERECVSKADTVTSCTNLLYNMMKERNQIQREDVIVIGNPANVDNFYNTNTPKDNSIFYLGGLEQRKGVLILAKAISIVLNNHPDIIFKFVGKDTNSNDRNISTIEYIKSLVDPKYHSNLEFIGHINNDEVTSYCSKSIIGVVPSSFDNLPYVAMEELLCELPLIASDNTGVIEMIENNKSGMLFENGNSEDLAKKIIELYNDEAKRKEMGCLGRKAIIEKFSPNKIALQNVDIYQDTINKFNLKKFFQNMQKIEKVPYGIANFVYKIETKENVYIAKCYREGMKKNNLSPIIYNKSIHEFLITSNILENESMTIMNHIQGSHQDILTDEEINVVIDFIKYFHAKDYEVEMLKDKIVNFSLQSYSKRDEAQKELSNFWQENSIQIERILSSDLVVSHGDLSSTNILLSNQTIAFLDFDELCLAPKYYDLAVFIIKHCFINGEWNNVYAEKIKNLYQLKNQDFNEDDFNFTILLYLYKIIEEKFYWESKDLIDLESEIQRKDNYMNYYLLFKEYLKKCNLK